jgi:effector-binding domain-containing protein
MMTDTHSGPSTDTVVELSLPPSIIVGLRERVAMADLSDFFGRAMPAVASEFARLGIAPAGPPTAVYRHEIHQDFDVTAGFPVTALPPDAKELAVVTLPPGPAVLVEHSGPYETLPAAYAAMSAWFGEYGLTPPDMMWEEYLVGPATRTSPSSSPGSSIRCPDRRRAEARSVAGPGLGLCGCGQMSQRFFWTMGREAHRRPSPQLWPA